MAATALVAFVVVYRRIVVAALRTQPRTGSRTVTTVALVWVIAVLLAAYTRRCSRS